MRIIWWRLTWTAVVLVSLFQESLLAQSIGQEVNSTYALELLGSLVLGDTRDVAAQGDYAYVTDRDWGEGLRIIDFSDPSSPQEVGTWDAPSDAEDVFVREDYAYVAAGGYGLRIIDFSDPSSPLEVASLDTPGYAQAVFVQGNYAYVADGFGGLRIIDISDPSSPLEVGTFYAPGRAEGVYVQGDHAYVADRYEGLRIIDISDPFSPLEVGSFDTPGYASGVYAQGKYVYVADRGAGLFVLEFTAPATPSSSSADAPSVSAKIILTREDSKYSISLNDKEENGEHLYTIDVEVIEASKGFSHIDDLALLVRSDSDIVLKGLYYNTSKTNGWEKYPEEFSNWQLIAYEGIKLFIPGVSKVGNVIGIIKQFRETFNPIKDNQTYQEFLREGKLIPASINKLMGKIAPLSVLGLTVSLDGIRFVVEVDNIDDRTDFLIPAFFSQPDVGTGMAVGYHCLVSIEDGEFNTLTEGFQGTLEEGGEEELVSGKYKNIEVLENIRLKYHLGGGEWIDDIATVFDDFIGRVREGGHEMTYRARAIKYRLTLVEEHPLIIGHVDFGVEEIYQGEIEEKVYTLHPIGGGRWDLWDKPDPFSLKEKIKLRDEVYSICYFLAEFSFPESLEEFVEKTGLDLSQERLDEYYYWKKRDGSIILQYPDLDGDMRDTHVREFFRNDGYSKWNPETKQWERRLYFNALEQESDSLLDPLKIFRRYQIALMELRVEEAFYYISESEENGYTVREYTDSFFRRLEPGWLFMARILEVHKGPLISPEGGVYDYLLEFEYEEEHNVSGIYLRKVGNELKIADFAFSE